MAELIGPNGQTVSVSGDEEAEWRARGYVPQQDVLANNPGHSLEDIRSLAGTVWNTPGGQGYLDSLLGRYNDPTSDPTNPQPFAPNTPTPPTTTLVPNPVTSAGTTGTPAAKTPEQELAEYIAQLNGSIDQAFVPGFERSRIGSDTGQALISQLLDPAYNDAATNLNYQRARGNLNDTGFARAQKELGSQRAGNQKTLQDALSGLVTEGRRNLTDISDAARAAAAGVTSTSTPFDLSIYTGDADRATTDFLGGLEGALRSRIDPSTLFDTSTAVQRGAQSQGYVNPGALVSERSRYSPVKRGLGSNGGVF